ncbi:MAG: hypothetical protein U0992_04940 [Planctomycetaceae bacterium]
MGAVVFGQRLCGQVDRISGLCYVSTQFWHIDYVPLIPLRSYVIAEGSEDGEGGFRGVQIRMSPKSVIAGYLRAWLAGVAIFGGIMAVFALSSYYTPGEKGTGSFLAALAAGATLVAALWYVFATHSRRFVVVQLALLAVSAAVYHDVRADQQAAPPAVKNAQVDRLAQRRQRDAKYVDLLLIVNGAVMLYSLTRLMTPVSYERAIELGAVLGLPEEKVAAILRGPDLESMVGVQAERGAASGRERGDFQEPI